MLRERIREFFHDLGDILKRIVTSRMVPFALIGCVLFGLLIYRLFILQIVNGENYTTDYSLKTQRTITTLGTRGNIYDCNGELLAYSELCYNVIISDTGYYKNTKERNKILNRVLSEAIDIIEDNGDTVNYDFHIRMDEHGRYYYDIADNALLRFLRDVYGRPTVAQLKDEERNATAEETIAYMAKYYGLDMEAQGRFKTLQILYIRFNMSSNLYQRYVTFTIASNVSQDTMACILENEADLQGVDIEEGYIRHYNYSVCLAQILGYTGKISESELDELLLVDDTYDANDVIGKAGIEAEMETTLAGKKGHKTVLVDNVGRIQQVIEEVPAERGQDVYLTIDAKYQQKIYDLLERRLSEVLNVCIVNSDARFDEQVNMVTVPIVDAYNALISNNMISMDKIAASDSETAKAVYQIFSDRKSVVLGDIQYELNNGTIFNYLSNGMKSYLRQVRNLLIDNHIINSEKIDASSDLSEKWTDGKISLRQYLEEAIHNDWINIYNLNVPNDYPTYDEVLDAIIAEAMIQIEHDKKFDKLVYSELIKNKYISGRAVCLLLMEQKAVNFTESEYVSIYNGASTYDFIKRKINDLSITPAQLALDPCSGSVVVENPNNGQLVAMVTYPSYDNNYFSGVIDSEYYQKLLDDASSPLLNRCTQTKLAPGSTFKPLMTIAGLNEGVIDERTRVECTGIFDKVTPNIRCHVYPNNHGFESLFDGLKDSCNVFFCETGYRLACKTSGVMNHENGLKLIAKYADILGLATKTGIQLPETAPQVSDYNALASSIGQGTHAYTSLNLARYLSTISNRGTVYDTSVILKTVNADGSDEHMIEPVIYKHTDIDNYYWNLLEHGMSDAVNVFFGELGKNLPVTIYGKSGTAQEDKTRGNHAVYLMYTRNQNYQSDICVCTVLPYAYGATNSGIMDYYALCAYFDIDLPKAMYFNYKDLVIIDE